MPGYVDGKQIWEGFPYQSNEAMEEDLHKLLDPIFFTSTDQPEPGSGVVLMTHCGPRESCRRLLLLMLTESWIMGSA